MVKRHVATVYAHVNDQWRLFAEGCLRNRYFHEEVFLRGPRCLACERQFNRQECQVRSKIEKHHNDYLHLCQYTGPLLPKDHDDIYRPATKDEFDQVPDCRQCHMDDPAKFEACLKRIYPVHSSCHERIHDKERHFNQKARQDLQIQFDDARG